MFAPVLSEDWLGPPASISYAGDAPEGLPAAMGILHDNAAEGQSVTDVEAAVDVVGFGDLRPMGALDEAAIYEALAAAAALENNTEEPQTLALDLEAFIDPALVFESIETYLEQIREAELNMLR